MHRVTTDVTINVNLTDSFIAISFTYFVTLQFLHYLAETRAGQNFRY